MHFLKLKKIISQIATAYYLNYPRSADLLYKQKPDSNISLVLIKQGSLIKALATLAPIDSVALITSVSDTLSFCAVIKLIKPQNACKPAVCKMARSAWLTYRQVVGLSSDPTNFWKVHISLSKKLYRLCLRNCHFMRNKLKLESEY